MSSKYPIDNISLYSLLIVLFYLLSPGLKFVTSGRDAALTSILVVEVLPQLCVFVGGTGLLRLLVFTAAAFLA